MDDGYFDWYYRVSHPCLVEPPLDEMREVLILVYNERPSNQRLASISHEMHHYLQRHEADEEDDEFAEIFWPLRVAQGGSIPMS